MKAIVHPITGNAYRLGRRPSPPARHLRLGAYLKPAEPPSPPQVCHYSPAAERGLAMCLGNDDLSDCVAAAAAHLIDVWRGNAGVPGLVSQAEAIAFYSRAAGYVPGKPETDQGGDLLTAMRVWRDKGFFADGSGGLSAWAAVDATDPHQVMTAVWLFEGLYMGACLPDAWLDPMPAATGFVWSPAGAADPQNGHSTATVGYNAVGVQIATWGMIGTVTWPALAAVWGAQAGGELYALLSPEVIARATLKAASGFDLAALAADLAAL